MAAAPAAHRAKLLARIQRRYAVSCREVRFGDLKFDFSRVADPDRVLDDVAREADRIERVTGLRAADEQLHLPYWAELWDSAGGIARHLIRRGQPGRGSALDLGCGMGLAGTVAAAIGFRVLFADLETPALLFARLNSLPWRDRVRTRRLNWRVDHLGERFDLILGADILYERTQWEFIEPFCREHLAPGGAVLLAEPGRQTGDRFIDWIRPRPWELRILQEPVPERPAPIRIFELRAAPGGAV